MFLNIFKEIVKVTRISFYKTFEYISARPNVYSTENKSHSPGAF